MNIRKADSKGRITGFTPGAYYRQTLSVDAGITLAIVAPTEPEPVLLDQPATTPKDALDYLASFGLDPVQVSREGADRRGYYSFVTDATGKRRTAGDGKALTVYCRWPEGFDVDKFIRLVNWEHRPGTVHEGSFTAPTGYEKGYD